MITGASISIPDLEEVQILKVNPGEAVVFRTPYTLSDAAIWRVKDRLKEWTRAVFGREVQCLVLEAGATIETADPRALLVRAVAAVSDLLDAWEVDTPVHRNARATIAVLHNILEAESRQVG